jgi:hypothetical protein
LKKLRRRGFASRADEAAQPTALVVNKGDVTMAISLRLKAIAAAAGVAAVASLGMAPSSAVAQQKGAAAKGPMEQFIPVLVYRTGPYGPNGTPWANGFVDYLKLVNQRDGGIGGVKLTWEECETGYATDRGVECYERLKSKGRPVGVQSAVHRHHLSRSPTRCRQRQDPHRHDGLWPLRLGSTAESFHVELPAAGKLLGSPPTS